jgi:glycosyltransferase involved in cell wall biosynthesis
MAGAKFISIVLNSIVKNEKKTLPRMLSSIEDLVSGYVVVDTGSTDGTPDILKAKGIDVYHRPFDNFGASREHALKLGMSSVSYPSQTYLLLMDADMVLRVEDRTRFFEILRDEDPDVVMIAQRAGSLLYSNVRLVRASLTDANYTGVTHEYMNYPSSAKLITIPESVIWIEDVGDGGCKEDKLERDRRLLEGTEQTPRTLFYLAQTYRDMGLTDLAVSTYLKRIGAGGWIEEIVYSRYMLLKLYLHTLDDVDKAVEQANLIRRSGRQRPEPMYHMCSYWRTHNDIPEAVKYLTAAQMSLIDVKANLPLFYEEDVEEIFVPFSEFMLWYHVHPQDRPLVSDLTKRLLSNPKLPADLRACIETNYSEHYIATAE